MDEIRNKMSFIERALFHLVKAASVESVDRKTAPWLSAAAKGGIPAAVLTSYLMPVADSMHKRRVVSAFGALGAGASMLNHYYENKNKPGSNMRKVAALAGDARMLGIGNVKRPPFPTQGSLTVPTAKLKKSQSVAKVQNVVKVKDVKKVGPSIKQVATLT